jgi:hypothetical protein
MVLDLVGDYAKAKDVLKVGNAPRLSWLQLVVTDAQQKPMRLCQMLCTLRLGSVLFNSNSILELCPRDNRAHLLGTV